MITVRNIVQNIGKGQSALAVRVVLGELEKYYHKIKSRIQIINSGVLADGTGIHLKIPSSDKPIFYDVVLWIKTMTRMTLDTEFKCYSNSPNFGYAFAYTFNAEGSLLFPEKYPQEFVLMPPKVRNPYGLYGFDKGVFAGVKHIGFRDIRALNEQFMDVPEQPVTSFTDKQNEIKNLT